MVEGHPRTIQTINNFIGCMVSNKMIIKKKISFLEDICNPGNHVEFPISTKIKNKT